ncbi:MAG: response regulator [Methylobacter sp.]|nr:response regulator [Methylobacter sp.]MDP2098197.1 response regulator [Methylobacter sp.]MDP2428085.1 response regulator [Methylobacter sp.]MDP3055124.1 response regulator [Methylobacter sp.]MDZ4217668.1 response regulator [Methylobacter sp.]
MTLPPANISQKILFVDDEILVLEGIKRQLRRQFDISVAEGGEAALALLAESEPFAVVVSDYNMPGMDGIAFLNAVYQRYPHTTLIMLTGRAELDLAVNALHNAHISRFLNKPCAKEILQETLIDGIEQYRLRRSEQLLQQQLQHANQQLNQLNNELESRVEQKTRALKLQYAYVASMAQMLNSQAIVTAFVSAASKLTQLDDMTLWLCPQLDGQFSCHYPNNAEPIDVLMPTAAMLSALDRTALNTVDSARFSGQALLSIPLQSKQGTLGLLNLAGAAELETDMLDALTGMADVTATALQSHWHREAFDDAQDAIITALAKLSEYRDPETGSHLLRLKKYSALICRFLAETDPYRDIITQAFTDDLVRSSPLHDIGKVGIPDAILKKPGKLTPEEFEIMKTHAQIGGDTLRTVFEQYPSQSFIKCGMDVAYGHHERWDGTGYPFGLKGEAIPLVARILALVDVYDALTCRRVYKPPFPREQAKAIITDGSGSHFDPAIVTAFLTNEAEFHQIAEQLADKV